MLGHPVEGNLNGDHAFIRRRFPQHLQEGVHPIKGEGKQLVLFHNLRQEGVLAPELGGFLGGITGIEVVGILPQNILNLEEKGQIQRRSAFKYRLFLHIQSFAQFFHRLLAELTAQFQPHRLQFFPLLYQICHKFPIVQIFVIDRIGVNIGAAGKPQQRLPPNLVAFEGQGQKVQNQFLREHILSLGNGNQPGKYPGGAGDDAHLPLAVFPVQYRHGVDFLIAQEGKGLALADNHGRKQRQHLPGKISL